MDDETPRRRRGAKAVAVEAEQERGLVMRLLMHSPKDTVAGLLAVAAISAIVANALFLQAGRHPSPMFGATVAAPAQPLANPLPRPRPVEIAPRSAEPPAAEAKAESKSESKAEPKADAKPDPMANLVAKAAVTPAPTVAPAAVVPTPVVRPPAPVPVAAPRTAAGRRIAAVQRTLTEHGYGQLKPTGMIGSDTQDAIMKFERDRKLPVTGQMSDRLVRELSAMTGRPID
jgi:Putative peptidoglycan binding domain